MGEASSESSLSRGSSGLTILTPAASWKPSTVSWFKSTSSPKTQAGRSSEPFPLTSFMSANFPVSIEHSSFRAWLRSTDWIWKVIHDPTDPSLQRRLVSRPETPGFSEPKGKQGQRHDFQRNATSSSLRNHLVACPPASSSLSTTEATHFSTANRRTFLPALHRMAPGWSG